MRPFAAFAVAAAILCSCGVKGDPRPPLRPGPGDIDRVQAWPREDHVLVKWKIPGIDAAGMRTAPISFIVEKKVYIAYGDRWSGPVIVAEAPGPFNGAEAEWKDFDVREGKYAYRVIAVDANGRHSAPSALATTVWVAPPGIPKIVKVVGGDRTATIEWSEPAGGVDGYFIYREGPNGFVRMTEHSLPGNQFFDGGLVNGVEHRYIVRATRQAGASMIEGPPSEVAAVTPIDRDIPMVPVGVDAFPIEGGVLVKWWPNEEPDLKGYKVYRKEGKSFDLITPQPVEDNEFRDMAAKTGKTYYYTVSAVDRAGNESPRSEQAKVYVKR